MITKAPDAGGLPTTSDSPRREETAARRSHRRTDGQPQKRTEYRTENATVVVEPDRSAWILRPDGYDRTAELPDPTLDALEAVADG